MKRYHVYGVVRASKYLGEFEAESPEDAVELGLKSEEASVSVCFACSGEVEEPEIHEATAEEVAE